MMHTLRDAVHQALHDGFHGLWATGDMSWEFGPKRDFSKLMEYECRLEEFIRQQPALSGICLYHADTLPREAMLDGLSTHSSLFLNETLSRMNPHYVPPGSPSPAANRPAAESTLDELCRSQEPS